MRRISENGLLTAGAVMRVNGRVPACLAMAPREIVLRAGPQGRDASVYGALTSGVLNAPERAYNFALAPVFNDRPAPVPQPGPNDLEILPNDRWQSPLLYWYLYCLARCSGGCSPLPDHTCPGMDMRWVPLPVPASHGSHFTEILLPQIPEKTARKALIPEL